MTQVHETQQRTGTKLLVAQEEAYDSQSKQQETKDTVTTRLLLWVKLERVSNAGTAGVRNEEMIEGRSLQL